MSKDPSALRIQVYERKPEGFSPKVEVAAIYVNVMGRLLLLQLASHKSEAGSWGVPAGKLQVNEAPLQGAKRELSEETGIDVASDRLLQPLGSLYIRKTDLDYVYHMFALNLHAVPTILLSKEHVAYKWVSNKEAENLNLIKGAAQALDFYYSRKKPH
jgi:8-oxo-dGTP diphosphatase